ncbi:hypothetical protein [Agromyces marinus]|uniref:Uncharacterized protein n=1 Tax=Agromyces marinus TaxID=1389020 RepID=A0ABM8H3W7_9MICO|nr:hypothetical protein [Agromyces marinus]UIP59468.1 hypothetical protein DSM26151_23750 [Agromyces marinus]BDZ55486.1 hypothetical protein GCM10025870_25590 [Agromyces marinus]
MPDDVPVFRRPSTWLATAVIVLVVAAVALVGVLMAPAPAAPVAETASRPSPATDAAPAPVVVPTPEPVRDERIPEDCTAIYTFDWSAEFAPDYVLNPEWSTADGAPALFGTDDAGALPILQETSQATCAWLPPDGGDGRDGLVTSIASLDGGQAESTVAAFQNAGMECYEELGGTRCIAEWEGNFGLAGESHFLRDGIWIATRWDGPAVSGYTLDIVTAVLGG